MDPRESTETKGQGEHESYKPKKVKPPKETGTEGTDVGKEITGDVPALNGQDREVTRVSACEETPPGHGEESAVKEGEGQEAKLPESTETKEPDSKEREELPAEEDRPEGATSLPNTPVSSPAAASGSASSSAATAEQIAEPAPEPHPSPASQPEPPDFYCVKWISWKGERTPIITQSENGPCPLLAIMNILFLQWKVKLPPQKEVITSDELMAHLGDCILSIKPQKQSEVLQLNFQQNVNDAMMVLPKLSTGLDVNVKFTGVSDFEYTPECIVFDLLNMPLYHGWLVDPQIPEVAQAIGKLSYNQLVEKIITCKHSSDPNLVTEGLLAEQFLESTASQLTYHGLCELTSTVKEGELSVFFRNNHFSTMIKHKSHLYLLVTDQGFLHEEQVAWESLHNVDGDSCFCDAEFHLSHALGKEAASGSPEEQHLNQRQVDQDYMIALSLQQQQGGPTLSDLELAQQLQQEEYQQQLPSAVTPPAQGRTPPPPRSAGERRQRQKQDSDCVVL
ncbi:ubiquitin carboxyl-terminal hydrolase MINDY-1 [Rhineura floridana]|uniref:ubiquitin carboxyl-terminal hydrolase MINDY-1 n=1 Tax=Rhineura floridana TaxID=261503 RepID=UPI002AC82D24|nr:ubiquitin carboxyl-terminal hydrolase MINDY-1 [Rhineura floridana]XP_061462819.1 ubiquitin carboxyl-terminal hydrolase MINDY-1 [Rhineura floridana]XP_061462820.1 ubiquitin carboxyl-terminal hydrolase MINDY-1 [Rhineura floridana]